MSKTSPGDVWSRKYESLRLALTHVTHVTQVVGEFHLGELVNRFQQGSLVVKMTDQDALQVNTVLYGTINGVIGVIASLPQPLFEYLNRLQVRQDCMLSEEVTILFGVRHCAAGARTGNRALSLYACMLL
jgi:hypothetical protein